MKSRALLAFLLVGAAHAETIDIKDGWFRVDGEPVFIKGVCYFDNHTVDGQYRHNTAEEMDHEFARIHDAGFNAIRSALNPEDVALARKHGLLVLTGWGCFESDFENPSFVAEDRAKLLELARSFSGYDNMMGCGIGNEPQVQKDGHVSPETAINAFYSDRAAAVHAAMPGLPVSLSTFPLAAFIQTKPFDFASINLYPHPPSDAVLDYAHYADWFRRRHAVGKPMIMTEYGYRFVDGEANFVPVMLKTLDDQIAAGAVGSFFYTWREFENERDPNLWIGVVPTDGKSGDYTNAARPILEDFKKYFEAVIVDPKPGAPCVDFAAVRVFGSERTASMTVDSGKYATGLERSGKWWWTGKVRLTPSTSGEEMLVVTARDADGNVLVEKSRVVQLRAREEAHLKVVLPCIPLRAGDTAKAMIIAENDAGEPVQDLPVRAGIHQTGRDPWTCHVLKGATDSNGTFSVSWKDLVPGYFTVFAGGAPHPAFSDVLGDAETIRVDAPSVPAGD